VSRAFSAYGLPLGEAFQLRDDVLGVFGDPAVTGKPAGDDLREGKRTYLVAATFDGADDATARELRAGLGDPTLDEQRIRRLREIITSTGALARTEARIAELTAAALGALDAVPLTAEGADALTRLAAAATRRSG
jgi:geranylgeranyl diphosphate synthase type I